MRERALGGRAARRGRVVDCGMRRMMKRIAVVLVLAGGLVAHGGLGAFAAEADPRAFVSGRGYRITAPKGWDAASEELIATATEEAQGALRRLRSRPGGSGVDMILFDPSGTAFMNNLTVSVVDAPISVTPEALALHRRNLVREAAEAGAEMEILEAEIADLGPARGYSVTQRTRYAGMDHDLRQWMAVIPAGSRTLHVTGTALEEGFEDAAPAFREAVASIRVEVSAADRWHHLPFAWKAAAMLGLAAAAAGAAALHGRLRRRREGA